jgi:glycosyltransferase involved in cell wall biosynthesis
MNAAILIPAFRPGPRLTSLLEQLAQSPVAAIIIVDDGSGPEWRKIFDDCARIGKVRVLTHPENLGKGAAIKTAVRHILQSLPTCPTVVTADADGQHHPDDILRVVRTLEQNPDCLVLGSRQFNRDVPWRSRIGNVLTRVVAGIIVGQSLRDTQTGLRGVPVKLLPFLPELRSNGYEFELDMLIAAKHHGCSIIEETIRTIYEPGNPTSHFNPLRDSMRIYFVLFRLTILSLVTAALDNAVFIFSYHYVPSILASQTIGRAVAIVFNYPLARKAVFLSHQRHRVLFPKYLLLIISSGAVSYALIRALMHTIGIVPIAAKVSAESLLFIVNFLLQRDFVFTARATSSTDWTRYHRSVPVSARLTRKYTARVLVEALKRFRRQDGRGFVIVELGGANSCLVDKIMNEVRPSAYHVVVLNDQGLNMMGDRADALPQVRLHRQNVLNDILNVEVDVQADTVFSVGLIEHFDSVDRRRAILQHFDLLTSDGYAILSFPTPTWLYRTARSVTELLGLWKFPDERPLSRSEVLGCIPPGGEVVFEKTLWPLVFTQRLIVVRKHAA